MCIWKIIKCTQDVHMRNWDCSERKFLHLYSVLVVENYLNTLMESIQWKNQAYPDFHVINPISYSMTLNEMLGSLVNTESNSKNLKTVLKSGVYGISFMHMGMHWLLSYWMNVFWISLSLYVLCMKVWFGLCERSLWIFVFGQLKIVFKQIMADLVIGFEMAWDRWCIGISALGWWSMQNGAELVEVSYLG